MSATLATIGYQGASIAGFIGALKDAGVRVLIDVRDVPYSRRAEFSSRALAASLREAGLEYVHLQKLGSPKPVRDTAKAGEIDAYRRMYREHLAGAPAQADLDRLSALTEEGGACVMCYERDPADCHRSLLAAALAERMPLAIQHLMVIPLSKPTPAQGRLF